MSAVGGWWASASPEALGSAMPFADCSAGARPNGLGARGAGGPTAPNGVAAGTDTCPTAFATPAAQASIDLSQLRHDQPVDLQERRQGDCGLGLRPDGGCR